MAGQYAEAIDCYSKAIELGSEVKAEELSTFHQNRAAAEEHMVRLTTTSISHLQLRFDEFLGQLLASYL